MPRVGTALILVIVIGGTLLFAGGLIWFLVWNGRQVAADEKAALGRLRQELPQRGWTYAERDDRFAEVYNAQQERLPRDPMRPFVGPPKASAARDVITGTHRGRPFLAATFRASANGQVADNLCIWVRTPAVRPYVDLTKTVALASSVNEAIGRDLRTGNPDFDRAFDVTTDDPQFALAVLTPRLAEFLLTTDRDYRGVWLQADFVDASDQVRDHRDPRHLLPALDFRCDILDRIPPQIWG
ncbi:hypothetical protein GCM10027569_47120 [Flindersiella endophytica]